MARRRSRLGERLRANFLTGLAVVLPAGLTLALIAWAAGLVDARVAPFVPMPFAQIAGAGVVVFVLVTVLAGAVARHVAGRRAVRAAEGLVARVPVARVIHAGARQLVAALVERRENAFRQVCLLQYPRPDVWAVGFVAGPAGAGLEQRAGSDDLTAVFLPTTPVPARGYLVYVRRSELRMLDMPLEEALRLAASGGLVGGNGAPVRQPA
jgi:uncharacterized membrane protein